MHMLQSDVSVKDAPSSVIVKDQKILISRCRNVLGL